MHADLDERAGIDQQVDPLARGQLALRVLRVDLLGAPAELDLRAAVVQVVHERLQPARLSVLGRLRGRDLTGMRLGGIARDLFDDGTLLFELRVNFLFRRH